MNLGWHKKLFVKMCQIACQKIKMLLAPANGKLRQYSQHVYTESNRSLGKCFWRWAIIFFRVVDQQQIYPAVPGYPSSGWNIFLLCLGKKYLHNTSYNSFQFGNNVDHKSKCVQPFFSSLMYILWLEKIVYASVIRRELIFQHNHFSLFCHIFFCFH